MGKFTKRDHETVARVMREFRKACAPNLRNVMYRMPDTIAANLADLFALHDSEFDKAKFLKDCGWPRTVRNGTN